MNRMAIVFIIVLLFTVGVLLVSWALDNAIAPSQAAAGSTLPTMTDDKPRDYSGLHNVVPYHEGFYSGSVPEGDAGFEMLVKMGVKTIISVDGAAPDVEKARARGIRYIHLPIGYNGFDEQRKLQLVRATRDAMNVGSVYMHCHHGRHRSAGAAGTVAASLGWATSSEMVQRMQVSGTARKYTGLYACTTAAVALSIDVIDAVPADFPETARPTGFVKGMVEIDQVHEHLIAIERAGWTTPADHPDLVPVAEAGRMADLFRVLGQGDFAQRKPADFASKLHDGQTTSQTIEDLLGAETIDRVRLSGQFKRLTASCRECHAMYRD